MWNREPASPSFGSFDRAYWGWKYKDFSDATLQYGVRLAVEFAKARGLTGNLPSLLAGYAGYCNAIQLKDGSFNQCYPFERTPGVIYDILSTLIYVRQSPYLLDSDARDQLDSIIENAVVFALRTDEKHGEVANHLAEYAYELLNYAAYTGSSGAKRKAEQYVERFLTNFEPEEGWFLEYNGPDPGYQSRCMRYLGKIAAQLNSAELWGTLSKAADFSAELLMPDGSIHPMLGCRSTALLYPSGFELLASRDSNYAPLAERVQQGWQNANVPLPSQLDFDNALRLGDDAFDAHEIRSARPPLKLAACPHPDKDVDFPVAGISIRRKPDRVVYVGSRLGGVVVAYTKTAQGNWQLAFEDSGYVLKSKFTDESWLTRMPGAGRTAHTSPDHIQVEAGFSRSLHSEVTPLKLLVLRTLNLTVLRFQWFGDIFRKLVVRMLMDGKHGDPLTLCRDIHITDEGIQISDRLEGNSRLVSEQYKLWRCRRSIGAHMASSRYFQLQELSTLPLTWMEQQPWPQSSGQPIKLFIQTGSEKAI